MQNEVFLSGCDFLSFCDFFFSLKIYIIHKFAKKKYLLLCRCLVLSSDSKNLATEGYLIIWNCLIAEFQIRMKVKVKSLSRARLFATPWTVAYQAPRSVGFSRQEYWSGLLRPPPADLPNSGIEPASDMYVNRMSKLHRNKNQTTPREGTRIIEWVNSPGLFFCFIHVVWHFTTTIKSYYLHN